MVRSKLHGSNGFGCSGKNVSPALSWSGAPAGDKPHRCVFTVWALKVEKLDLNGEASGAMVGFYLRGNSLGTATLTAEFGR